MPIFKPRNYIELCMAMKTRATVDIDGVEGVINGIQAEDGSGRNWNVTLSTVDGLNRPVSQTKFFRE